MVGRDGGTFVSPTERTIPNDPERTLATPRFDEKSVQAARAAVPLKLGARVRSWPLAVVVTCVLVGLVGGALVGFGLTYYFNDGSHDARQQAAGDATNSRDDSQSAANTSATSAQPEKTSAQDATTNAQNTTAGGSAQPSNVNANDNAAGADTVRGPSGAATESSTAKAAGNDSGGASAEPDANARGELQAALGDWLAATNARDIESQMKFYAPTVEAYYLKRNASRESVRAEKARVFGKVDSVDVRASSPEIELSRDGQTAVMRFRKRYRIGGGESGRSGEVLQELRWRRTPGGWKIVGERDLRVLQ
ncbi:MAG TPA: nuclear transport factor 2 family protein [Pyrinomonadaceae bacterium]|nr:nuclear transport factor 2 family protein [Pyrinomonadaceae bacterium]